MNGVISSIRNNCKRGKLSIQGDMMSQGLEINAWKVKSDWCQIFSYLSISEDDLLVDLWSCMKDDRNWIEYLNGLSDTQKGFLEVCWTRMGC